MEQNTSSRNLTVKQLAELIGEDYIVATSFMKVLVKIGAAKEVGKQSAAGGRGKPSSVFEVQNEFECVLWEANAPETVSAEQVNTAIAKMVETSAELAKVEIGVNMEEKIDKAETVS